MWVSSEALGGGFDLPREPRRIVSLVSAATETVAVLGGRERLVGVSPYCGRYVAGLAAPVAGDYLRADPDVLRRLAPDLVLLTTGAQLPLARRCAAAGLPAYALALPASRFGVLENILAVGALLGRTRAARDLADGISADLEALRASRSGRRPRVYAELWFGRHPRAAGGRTFVHDLVELAGGENVFGDRAAGYLPLDPAAAAEARPDVLLLFSEPEHPVDPAALLEERSWGRGRPLRVVVSSVVRGRNLIHDGPSFAQTAHWLAGELAG